MGCRRQELPQKYSRAKEQALIERRLRRPRTGSKTSSHAPAPPQAPATGRSDAPRAPASPTAGSSAPPSSGSGCAHPTPGSPLSGEPTGGLGSPRASPRGTGTPPSATHGKVPPKIATTGLAIFSRFWHHTDGVSSLIREYASGKAWHRERPHFSLKFPHFCDPTWNPMHLIDKTELKLNQPCFLG